MSAPVLILGATGGVGQALARSLAARRVPLALAARSRDKLADLARETGARHDACDVLDARSLDRVVEQAAAEGGLAGLAYCVGSIVI